MLDALIAKKHSILLAVVLPAEVLQAFATTPLRAALFDFLVAVLVLVTFLVVFENRRQRVIGLLLGAPGLLANWAHNFLDGRALIASEVLHEAFMCAFIAFAAATILRGIFQRKSVDSDAVVGAVCGYVLAGGAFGNLYALVELLSPGSFSVGTAIAGQLSNWHTRRFLFGYFSLVTLPSMGYGEVTPIAPVAVSLTWIEAVFGQFYLAVVVAQLVGMRMAPKPGQSPLTPGGVKE